MHTPAPSPFPPLPGEPSDAEFLQLLTRCRGRGGLLRLAELAQRLHTRAGRPAVDALLGDIGARRVLVWPWRGEWWLPMFQFCPESMRVWPELRAWLCVMAARAPGWRLTAWLLEPCAQLRGGCPADALQVRPTADETPLCLPLLDVLWRGPD